MPLRTGTPIPELIGATEWVNGRANTAELIGSPVLIHFWAMSCHICHDNMPILQEWRERYAAQGLKVVAIHAPRQEDDTNIEAVHQAITEMGIEEPCAIDNMHSLVETFQSQYWPAYFLFDKEGALRSRAAGDAGIKLLEGTLTRLMEAEMATIA